MIAVRRGGRMGNQMFQLAFAHAASRRLGTSFRILEPPRSRRRALGPPLWDCFELGAWGRRMVRFGRAALFQAHFSRPLITVEQDHIPERVLAGLRDGAIYSGFFQSERWFAGFEEDIRRMFTVRRDHWAEFERYRPKAAYICMHVRRADYLDTNAWALPTSYFRDALGAVGDARRYELVIVSDDPPAVRRELQDLPGAACVDRPMMVDLLLLMNADAVITSNSSFSWWGAWLNPKPHLRVIAPKHWFGFASGVEEPTGVIPRGWTTVPVRDPPLLATPVPK